MKKLIISLLVVLSLGLGSQTAEQTVHASLLTDVASAVYIYKHRQEVKDVYQKAKSKAKTNGIPKFKVGKPVGNKQYLLMTNKGKTYEIGVFPKKLVQFFTQSKNELKNDLQKAEVK